MSKAMIVSLLLLALCGGAAAQGEVPADCPTISVIGPAGIPRPNEVMRYTAKVDTKGHEFAIQYFWTVSAGTIISGQGTTSIEVKPPENKSLTVTVEIKGLPDSCPATASETGIGDPSPEAIRIGVLFSLVSAESEKKLKEFASQVIKNPNNQAYVIIGTRAGAPALETVARERILSDKLGKLIGDPYDRPRITLVRWEGVADLIELWRVPPGAENPSCKECDAPQVQIKCPTISVTAPAGISVPGEIIYFNATISASPDSYTNLTWSVSDGEIITGQNTPTLGVRMPKMPPVRAKVNIRGLAKDCPDSASEVYDFAVDPGPENLGEVPIAALTIKRLLLNKIKKAMAAHPNAQLFIAVQFSKGASEKSMEAQRRRITAILTSEKFEAARITLVTAANGNRRVEFWLIRPGADNPAIDNY
jgi:hypothetical protein